MNRDYVTALSIPYVKYSQKPILVYCVAVIVKSILFILRQFTAFPAATCFDAGRESAGPNTAQLAVLHPQAQALTCPVQCSAFWLL